MSPYVLSNDEDNKSHIYDCYAVSNHFGRVIFIFILR